MMKVNKSELKKIVGSILGGEEESELDLVNSYSKFNNMKDYCIKYHKLFDMLAKSPATSNHTHEQELMQSYADLLATELESSFNGISSDDMSSIGQYVEMFPLIPKEAGPTIQRFLKYYSDMKKSSLINTIIVTCSQLVSYKRSLENVDALTDTFMTKSSMTIFEPVQDLKVNFKSIYISSLLSDSDKRFILLALHKIYTISKGLYDEYCKADINTKAFVQAVHITVDELRKKIPRCEGAFDKILQSTELLEGNYDAYYKDYISSNGNSSIIAENFIHDVAKTVDRSPDLARQFKMIITHLKKMTEGVKNIAPKQKDTFAALFNQAEASYEDIAKESSETEPTE